MTYAIKAPARYAQGAGELANLGRSAKSWEISFGDLHRQQPRALRRPGGGQPGRAGEGGGVHHLPRRGHQGRGLCQDGRVQGPGLRRGGGHGRRQGPGHRQGRGGKSGPALRHHPHRGLQRRALLRRGRALQRRRGGYQGRAHAPQPGSGSGRYRHHRQRPQAALCRRPGRRAVHLV